METKPDRIFPTNVNYVSKNEKTPDSILTEINHSQSVFANIPVIPYKCAYHAKRQELYIVDWDNHRIVVCDIDGRSARLFYRIDLPEDVAVSSSGEHVFILYCDAEEPESNSGPYIIEKVDLDGNFQLDINITPFGQLLNCSSVECFNGHVAVLSKESRCIIIYKESGLCLRYFNLDEVSIPSSMTVDIQGNFLVSDSNGGIVNIYSWSGVFQEKFGELEYGADSPGLCVDSDGFVCVARYMRRRIDVYTPERRLLTSLGVEGMDLPNLGRLLRGTVDYCRTLCLLPSGKLVCITDANGESIQVM